MANGKALLVFTLFLMLLPFSSAQVIVNNEPAEFTAFDTEDTRTYFVNAGKDDVITFAHESENEISLATMPGYMSVFSVAPVDKDLFDREFLDNEGYVKDGKVPVIVTLNVSNAMAGEASPKTFSAESAKTFESGKKEVLDFLGYSSPKAFSVSQAEPAKDLKIINAIALKVDEDKIGDIASLGAVRKVELDRKVFVNLRDSVPLMNATAVWRLLDANVRNITGFNITIAIIDTGVDYTHPDLGGCFGSGCKVAGGYDFVNLDSNPMDDHGHGTHVAATAAGNGTLNGVAPDAIVYAYKVLSAGGSGSYSQVISGVERATDPNNDGVYSDHLDILSMSLGGGGDENSALSLAVDRAVDRGVVAVVAAGNSGTSDGAIGTPGSALKAITIAATDKNDAIAYFSSRGPTANKNLKPDVAAPGVSICAAEWDSAWSSSRCIDTKHVSISGTSMATPHIAGLAALLLQKNRSWTPNMVKSAIVTTSKNLGQSVFAQGSGRANALNATNAKMLAFPAVVSFGKVSASNISQSVVIKNIHRSEMAFNITATNVTDGTNYYSIATANVSSVTIQSQQNVTINLSIDIGSRGGTFYGYINITSGAENYRIPFAFVRLTEVTVTVKNGTSALTPVIILVFDNNLVNYKWAYYWTFSGGTYTFTVPSGNYTAVALGDANMPDTTYILAGNGSAVIGSNTTIALNLASANNFTAAAQGLSSEILNLYKWQYMAVMRSGIRRLSTSMTYLGSSFEGNRTIQISSQTGGTNISVSFAYIGYPKRAKPSYESSYRWNDDTFTAADALYFAGWNMTNVTSSTPNVLNFSLSNLGVFNYTYNYPGYDPSIGASFNSYSSVFFWISPESWFDISSWIGTAASLKRTIYVMDNGFGFWHYKYMNYLKNSTLGGNWISEFAAMAGQNEDDTLLSTTWPYGTRFSAGFSREAHIGTSYLPSFFENSNTTIGMNKYILRGATNQTYVKKYNSVSWYSSDGSSGTVSLPRPEILVYRGSLLAANISTWTTVSQYVGSGAYKVNITLPTAYPLYNITYIDANFTLPSTDTNPPRIANLNVSKFFSVDGTVHVDFNITDNDALSAVNVYYSHDRSTWIPLNVTNISTVYNGTVSVNQAAEVSLKINATDVNGNSISYRFIPVALRQKNTLITLASSKTSANKGDTLILSGNIANEVNISQLRLAYETDGSFYQYDRSGYMRTNVWDTSLASGRLDFRYTVPSNYASSTLNISAVFNGTGIYPAAIGSVIVSVNVSTTTPSFSSLLVSPSSPDANDDIRLNVTVTASNGIDRVLFESNYSGTWVNYSTTNASGVYNYTINNASTNANTRIGYRFHANSTTNVNASTAADSVTVSAIATSISSGAAKTNVNPYENNTLFCDYTENGDGDVLSATVLADIGGNNTMTYNSSSSRYEVNYSSPTAGRKTWTCFASKGNFSSASVSHSFAVSETTAPNFGNVTVLGTVYNNHNLTLSTVWTDDTGIDVINFSSNFTGTWANYTIRANGAARYNASYNITSANMSNGRAIGWRYIANDTSGNINDLMPVQSFVVQNREPSIILHSNDNNKGFGESWSFTVNLSDADGDTLNVSFYATPANGTQQFIDSSSTTGTQASFTSRFNRSFTGQTEINFTVSDTKSSNSTSFTVTADKDDVTVNVTSGANQSVQRFGYNTLSLGITVFDTDRGEYVNGTARILWTKDGTEPYDDYADCAIANGSCSVTLDPDHAFSVGEQKFIGSMPDNSSFYKTSNSSQTSFIVNGTLFTSVNGPHGPHNFNDTVLFNTTVTDDTSSTTDADSVLLEYKYFNAADWKLCAPVAASENGIYTCSVNASSLSMGPHSIRYTALKENYTSFNTTVFSQFVVIKVMQHRQKINVTAFSSRNVRAENLNTTLDIVPRNNLTDMDVNMTFNTTNPVSVNLSVLELGKYLRINISGELDSNQSNLSYAIIKINYTDEELNQTGALEESLRIYKFNGTDWNPYDPPSGGVNTTDNYVWANVTSFSDFAVGGKKDNGVACSSSSECNSGNCASDYDGVGMWCAASGNCAHDYAVSYSGSLCDDSTLRTCSSGSWSSTTCSNGCSNGACITATPTPATSSGGGGGGGSVTLVPPAAEKPSQSVILAKITAGMPVIFAITDMISNISSVSITPNGNFASATVSVKEVSVPDIALDRLVYRYADIALTIPNVNITEARIKFSVPKSWLQKNEINPNSIVLYRLNGVANATWMPLETKRVSEDSLSHTYEAVTPGFSVFAVTGSKTTKKESICGNAVVEENEECDTAAQKTCKDFGFADGTVKCDNCRHDTSQCITEKKEPVVTKIEKKSDGNYQAIGAVALAIIAGIAILYRKKK